MSSLDDSIVADALERVLNSSVFRTSGRSAKLLRFLVEETLAGRADRLKDYTLGAEALGRGDSFDPRTDPIARVEASRLRSRLELYYATEGLADPVRITLPKGGYVPLFEERPVADAEGGRSAAPLPQSRTRQAIFRALALIGFAVLLGLFAVLLKTRPDIAPSPEMRSAILTPSTTDPLSLALSPDGKMITFVGVSERRPKLWLRPMNDETKLDVLEGTEGASFPFWSPDSRSIAFFAEGLLKWIDIESGLVKTLARAIVPSGGAWNKDGTIIFPSVPNSPLFRIDGNEGEPTALTRFLPGQNGHRAPQFLPDQRHFIYYAVCVDPAVCGVYVGDLLDGQFSRRVNVDADTPAVYVTGHLLFLRQGTLFAQRFNPDSFEVSGEAHPIAQSVAWGSAAGIAALSVSDAGLIAYRTGNSGRRQFVWFDRDGNERERLGPPADLGPVYLSLSPDDRLLVTQETIGGDTDIYMWPTHGGGGPIKLTSDHDTDIAPIFSPKEDRVVFASGPVTFNLYEVDLTGSPKTEISVTSQSKQPTDWVGDTLLFRSLDPETDWDIWALSMTGDRKTVPVVRTEFEERDARFSPDMKWIAYQSNESGHFEIYAQPYPGPGRRWKISKNGGASVTWAPGGKRLFYFIPDGTLMEVQISLSPGGTEIESVSEPVPLFQANVNSTQDYRRRYAVSSDEKFLVDTMVEETVPPITVIGNWNPPQ